MIDHLHLAVLMTQMQGKRKRKKSMLPQFQVFYFS